MYEPDLRQKNRVLDAQCSTTSWMHIFPAKLPGYTTQHWEEALALTRPMKRVPFSRSKSRPVVWRTGAPTTTEENDPGGWWVSHGRLHLLNHPGLAGPGLAVAITTVNISSSWTALARRTGTPLLEAWHLQLYVLTSHMGACSGSIFSWG